MSLSTRLPLADVYVTGRPAPKGSLRFVGHGRVVESSGRLLSPWMDAVRWSLRAVRPVLTDGPVDVAVAFALDRPARTRYSDVPYGRPDLDKLVRAVLDAATGIVWVDDGQVVRVVASKCWASPDRPAGARVTIWSATFPPEPLPTC